MDHLLQPPPVPTNSTPPRFSLYCCHMTGFSNMAASKMFRTKLTRIFFYIYCVFSFIVSKLIFFDNKFSIFNSYFWLNNPALTLCLRLFLARVGRRSGRGRFSPYLSLHALLAPPLAPLLSAAGLLPAGRFCHFLNTASKSFKAMMVMAL